MLKDILALIVSVLIAILLAEFIIRFAAPQTLLTPLNPDHPDFEPFNHLTPFGIMAKPDSVSPRYGENNQKTVVRHNSQGFRSDENYVVPEGKISVALVGDSFVYGHGNDQDEKISDYLQEILGEEYYVMNFGVPGWWLGLEYLLNKHYIQPQFRPDITVFFVVPNDLISYAGTWDPYFWLEIDENKSILAMEPRNFPINLSPELYQKELEGEQAVRRLRYSELSPSERYLLTHSHLYTLIESLGNRQKINASNIDDVNLGPFRKNLSMQKVEYDFLCFLSWLINGSTDDAMFVYVPSDFQVDKKAEQKLRRAYHGFNADDYDFNRMNGYLNSCWHGIGIESIDLTPVFRGHPDRRLYNSFLGHWSPEGTRIAAEEVAEMIMEQKNI